MSDHHITIGLDPTTRALFEELIGALRAARPVSGGAPPSAGGAVFPNFGKAKGQPVHGAAENDLRYYAHAAVRSLSDPSKERYHPRDREQLALFNAELARQGKPTIDAETQGSSSGPPSGSEPPPPGDDDSIPF